MTQIERILKEGIIDKSFLKEETICDFKVSKKLKKIQAIELDLLIRFDKVCKKHKLQYFLVAGTLLGAIRHKGFVPWDDDIDVGMLREDYDKFLKLAREFSHPYFFQTNETDKGYLMPKVRIRNSETTFAHKFWGHSGYNQGIFLDVFPFDQCSLTDREELFKEIDFYNSFNSAYMKILGNKLNDKGKALLINNIDLSPRQALDNIHKLCVKYRKSNQDYVTSYTSTGLYAWKRITYKKTDFSDFVNVDFCGYSFPAPVGYESVLRTEYGDYMKFPPLEERGKWHHTQVINPDISYKEYFARHNIKTYY